MPYSTHDALQNLEAQTDRREPKGKTDAKTAPVGNRKELDVEITFLLDLNLCS